MIFVEVYEVFKGPAQALLEVYQHYKMYQMSYLGDKW